MTNAKPRSFGWWVMHIYAPLSGTQGMDFKAWWTNNKNFPMRMTSVNELIAFLDTQGRRNGETFRMGMNVWKLYRRYCNRL